MQQFTLSLDDPQDITSRLELTPEREQRLIALMAEAILTVLQHTRETDDDERTKSRALTTRAKPSSTCASPRSRK